jgi:hypothetical protein
LTVDGGTGESVLPSFSFIANMIEAIFYKYNGKYNSLPKTLGTGTTLQGLLWDTYNVASPVITVRHALPFDFNYCYVPVFGKYYFINRVDVTGKDTARLTLSCDVLQTYADAILQSTGTVTQRDTPNKYVNDRVMKYDVRPNFETVNFPVSGLFNKDGSIIMVTIKGDK